MIRRLLCGLTVAAGLAGCGATAASPGSSPPAATASATAPAAATVPAQPRAAGAAARAATAPSVAVRTAAARAATAPSVAVRTAAGYGRLLVDGAGRTLYLFTADRGQGSACGGACAVAWPPLIVRGAPNAGPGIERRRLSLVRRGDGRLQLAYYGHPLYFYVGDRQAGQINCQDAEEYGGHWWLVEPSGQQNRSTP